MVKFYIFLALFFILLNAENHSDLLFHGQTRQLVNEETLPIQSDVWMIGEEHLDNNLTKDFVQNVSYV